MNNNIKLKAASSLLENWKIWIAIEAVEQFKNGFLKDDLEAGSIILDKNNNKDIEFKMTKKLSLLKLQSCENELKRKEFVELLRSISSQAIIVKKNINIFEDITTAKIKFTNYCFEKIYSELNKINEKVYVPEIISVKNIIIKKFKESNPIPFIQWINSILQMLNQQKVEVEKLKLYYLDKERGAHKAYSNLSGKVGFGKNNQEKIDEVWGAVKLIFESSLKRECCISISNMYSECIHLCQMYKGYAVASLEMLEKIKQNLNEKASIEMISIPLFSNLNVLDAKQQQKLLEVWIGHFINHWGNVPLTYIQLENKLLENLSETAEEIFQNFQACFIEMVSVENRELEHQK